MKKRALWITLASVLIVAAGIYGGISYYNSSRGQLWEEKKAELAANGIFTGRDFVFTRRVPAERNLWEAPITNGLILGGSPSDPDVLTTLMPLTTGKIKITSGRRLGEETKIEMTESPKGFPGEGSIEEKLELWSAPMRAGLELWSAEIETHPESQVIHLDDGKMILATELTEVKSALKLARNLRAIVLAKLKLGQVESALNEQLILLRLGEGFLDQPFLIDGLVGTAIVSLSLDCIYQGIKISTWDETQLCELDQRLARFDLLRSLRKSMNGELCSAIDMIEFIQYKKDGDAGASDEISSLLRLAKLLPHGAFDATKVDFADVYRLYFLAPLDPESGTIKISTLKEDPVSKDPRFNSHSVSGLLLKLMIPAVGGANFKAFNTDMDIKFTRIAIALERYKLRYQKYPTDLSALVPEFLASIPVDWAYQKAPSYEQTPEGRYRIWHPGWDGNDEGGVPSVKADLKKGDLVWTFEPIQPLPLGR